MNGFLLRSLPFTVSASGTGSIAPGSARANVGNDYMGMVARAIVSDSLMLIMDLGGAFPIDTIALLNAHIPSGATAWHIYRSDDATTWTGLTSPGMSGDELATGQGKRHPLHLFPAPVSARYWRVIINAQSGFQPEIARVLIGRRTQYTRNFDFGLQRGARDLGEGEYGVHGAMLRRRGRILRTLGLSWGAVSKEEAEARALPFFEAAGNTESVFACIDPAAHAERSRRCYFGTLEGNAAMTWRAHDMWEKRLQMVSVI